MPDGHPQPGGMIIAKDVGNKQLGAHFVPGDPRRGGFLDLAYITDTLDGTANGGLTVAQTTTEIDRAMRRSARPAWAVATSSWA